VCGGERGSQLGDLLVVAALELPQLGGQGADDLAVARRGLLGVDGGRGDRCGRAELFDALA
jgi:hypothetical protein